MDYLIHHMLLSSAARYPDKEALVDVKQRLSYAEGAKQSGAIAAGLRELGVQRGDRIGVWLESSVLQSIAIVGASQSGGVFVLIHHVLFPDQGGHIMRDCGTVGLITTKEKIASSLEVLETLPSIQFLISVDGRPDCDLKIPVYVLEETVSAEEGYLSRDLRIGKDLAAIL